MPCQQQSNTTAPAPAPAHGLLKFRDLNSSASVMAAGGVTRVCFSSVREVRRAIWRMADGGWRLAAAAAAAQAVCVGGAQVGRQAGVCKTEQTRASVWEPLCSGRRGRACVRCECVMGVWRCSEGRMGAGWRITVLTFLGMLWRWPSPRSRRGFNVDALRLGPGRSG